MSATQTTPGRTTRATRRTRQDLDELVPGYAGPNGVPAWTPEEAANARDAEPDDPAQRRGPLRPTQSAPPPANLNLIIPIGTLLGWSATPAQAGAFGLLDPEETQALVAAASKHPRTRWSITLTDPAGRAIAHGRARGQHPWEPPPPATPPPRTRHREHHHRTPTRLPASATSSRRSRSSSTPSPRTPATTGAPRTTTPPAANSKTSSAPAPSPATPPAATPRPSTATSTTPPPTPTARPTNATSDPKCRRHHRAKQAPGWRVEQPEPGTTRWTLPNGRTHTTTPTTYDF